MEFYKYFYTPDLDFYNKYCYSNNLTLLENIFFISNDDLNHYKNFESLINEKYLSQSIQICGLFELFISIQNSSEKDKLLNLIQNTGNKSLLSGKIIIEDIDNILLDLIMSNIRISNGNPSELWFAIMFNGKVKNGATSSDVEINGTKISIKNYRNINNLDFGSLHFESLKHFKKIINLLSILTNTELTASLTSNSINKLLKNLESKFTQEDITQMLNADKDHKIKLLHHINDVLLFLLSEDKNIEKLSDNFIKIIDELIDKKIKDVDWWAIIDKKNNIIYLEQSSIISNKIKSINNQLSPIIKQIKGNNLFINGHLLFDKRIKNVEYL